MNKEKEIKYVIKKIRRELKTINDETTKYKLRGELQNLKKSLQKELITS